MKLARKSRLLALGLLIVSIISIGLGLRVEADPIQLGSIMPLGDSITYGVNAPGGYRDPLYTDLTNAGYAFTFVGTETNNPSALLTSTGETHHQGESGYVIQTRDPNDPNPNGSGRSGIEDNIAGYVSAIGSAAKPDYFLLMIGTNDIDLNYYASDAPNRLSNLISTLLDPTTGLDPGAHLILAQIIPTESTDVNAAIVTYNSAMPGIVQQADAAGEKVSLVDMYDALDPSTDLGDTLHPNQQGYDMMAAVWTTGIEATVVPEPSTWSLLLGGLGSLELWRLRTTRRA